MPRTDDSFKAVLNVLKCLLHLGYPEMNPIDNREALYRKLVRKWQLQWQGLLRVIVSFPGFTKPPLFVKYLEMRLIKTKSVGKKLLQ